MNIFELIWHLLKFAVTRKTVILKDEESLSFVFKGIQFDKAINKYMEEVFENLPTKERREISKIASILLLAHSRQPGILNERQQQFMKTFYSNFVKKISRVEYYKAINSPIADDITSSFVGSMDLDTFLRTYELPVDISDRDHLKTIDKKFGEQIRKDRLRRLHHPTDAELEEELMRHALAVFVEDNMNTEKKDK